MITFGIMGFFNEYVLKPAVDDPKPDGGCAVTCGMPSGHAMNAGQLLTVFLMGLAIRVNPLASGETFCCWRLVCLLPISCNCAISGCEFIGVSLFWVFLLLPIPFSRVWNDDHTAPQVM